MSELVEQIQKTSVKRLFRLVKESLDAVERQVVDQIGSFLTLSQQQDSVLEAFVFNMNSHFDDLLDKETDKREAIFDFENLSLVQEEELDVMVALEGMVNASRNDHLPNFISFNTRLNSLFPGKRIDESTNPLDPDQIARSFQDALRPIGLDAQNNLAVYRAFNKGVLKNLDQVLREANQLLIDGGVIPDLGMEGTKGGSKAPPVRQTKRKDDIGSFGTVEEAEDEGDEQEELFSIMQNLLHTEDDSSAAASPTPGADTDESVPLVGDVLEDSGLFQSVDEDAGAQAAPQQYMVPTSMIPDSMDTSSTESSQEESGGQAVMQPFRPQEGQQVQMVDQNQLMEILSTIQRTLDLQLANTPQAIPEDISDVQKLNISESLGEMLNTDKSDEVITAVDRQSSDVINLVTLLYDAIWQDESVPIPIKELIGRTQITIIKVALSDTSFFNQENHPARAILNEFAAAGIGWTEVENLEEDPLYRKIQELVNRILQDYDGEIAFFEKLIREFRGFLAREAAKTRKLEQSILRAKERKERLEDIHELVTQKIDERLLGRDLDPYIKELLEDQFHRFMVMLVLKEGPGSNAWKQAINTIDVLLWSVQIHDQEGDRERLETINPRLLNNLRKAMRIASVEAGEIDSLINRLKDVQEATFPAEEPEPEEPEEQQIEESASILPLDLAQEQARADDDEEPEVQLEVQLETQSGTQSGTQSEVPVLETEESDSVTPAEPEPSSETASPVIPSEEDDQESEEKEEQEQEPEEDDSDYLAQVDTLNVGIWVEFTGEDGQNTRCKLAAKINAIDKFIFVNRQGVKVVEKTRLGLARELKEGTVRIISDGLLFSRALESVIGNLRESAHQQQTGSAYQPNQ